MPQQESTMQNEAHAVSIGSQESKLEPGDNQGNPIPLDLQGDSIIKLRWDSADYNVRAIDSRAFVVECVPMVCQHNPTRQPVVMRGTLSSKHNDNADIVFRVAGYKDDFVRCEFFKADQQTQKNIDAIVHCVAHRAVHRAVHRAAPSDVPNVTRQRVSDNATTAPKKAKSKTLAFALLAAVCLLVAGWMLGDPGETVSVADSFAGAQNLVVETPESGQLSTLLVKVGDRVEAGDVMAKLVKGEDMVKIESINAKLETTEKELQVFERQKQDAQKAVSRNKQTVQRNLELANQVKQKLAAKVKEAQANLQRVAPLIESDNIGTRAVAKLTDAVETAQADVDLQDSKIKDLRIALKAADRNAIYTEHGILTPTADIEDKIELAQARLTEQTRTRAAIEQIIHTVDIVAPEPGVVHAVHLSKDKQHQPSDQAIELQLGDRRLLTGFVAPERASSIEPGQSVEVVMPERKLTLLGKVTSVGQVGRLKIKTVNRRLPTDVAVQVQLEPTEQELNLKPDERINMCVTTKVGKANALAQWVRNIFTAGDSN